MSLSCLKTGIETEARKLEKIINSNVENIIIDAIINNEKCVCVNSLDKEKISLY